MIVYFENGWLNHHRALLETGKDLIEIDAGMGFNNCRRKLRYIKDNYPFDTEVYTNSLDAFSNFWCWDDEKKMPMIYIRDEYGQWKLIREMTDKELRIAHNLEKLYVNGAFCNVEQ
jgi:hypothetical protein